MIAISSIRLLVVFPVTAVQFQSMRPYSQKQKYSSVSPRARIAFTRTIAVDMHFLH